MSAKNRSKGQGTRKESRRPRGWVRWFRDGLLEGGSGTGVRLSTLLWGTPGT